MRLDLTGKGYRRATDSIPCRIRFSWAEIVPLSDLNLTGQSGASSGNPAQKTQAEEDSSNPVVED